MSATDIRQVKKSGKIQTAGICVACSIVLHLIVAVMICLRMITIEHTKAREVSDELPDKQEIVIQIKLDQETPDSEVVPMEDTSPPEERAPLTPQELREIAKTLAEPPKPIEPEAKPVEVKQTARTTADQLTGVPKETNIEGERNTIAASNTSPTSGAPEVSAIKGIEPVNDTINRVDTTFTEGEFDHADLGSKATEPQIPPPPKEVIPPVDSTPPIEQDAITKTEADQKEQEQIKSSVENTDEAGDALEDAQLAQTNQRNKEFAETINKVEMNQASLTSSNTGQRESDGVEEKQNTIVNKNFDPDGLKKKEQERREKEAIERAKLQAKALAQAQKALQEKQRQAAKNARAAEAAKSGFRAEARATAMQGSISSRSDIASQNVKATPTGKYMASISKQLETAWQKRMNTASHLAYPGILRVSFMVTKEGTVKNFDSLGFNSASAGQESIVHQAINSDLKIPAMPPEVIKDLGGDLLVLEYTFNFK